MAERSCGRGVVGGRMPIVQLGPARHGARGRGRLASALATSARPAAAVAGHATHASTSAATTVRKTFKHLMTEYGTVAVIVYFTIFFAVLFGFWAAIRFGWRAESTAGSVGTFTAAYIATKLTQPLRIAATLALTPIVAKLYERVAGRRAAPTPAPDAPGANDPV